MEKTFLSSQQLLEDSFNLALQIAESGLRPDLIAGVWRGGTPVGIAVHEVLDYLGIKSDHIPIRTSSYVAIGERSRVTVHGLEYLEQNLNAADTLLLVDDVYDSGLSIAQVIKEITAMYAEHPPVIKIATPYYKPENNQTNRVPDYFLHQTANWLVFPHELQGLSDDELKTRKEGMKGLYERLLAFRDNEA